MALPLVEIRGHCDHGAVNVGVERVFGTKAQCRKDFRADFHRRLVASDSLYFHHTGVACQAIRQRVAVDDICHPTPHQAFDRGDGVCRVDDACSKGIDADLALFGIQITHDRWQQHAARFVGQAFRGAVTHRSDERVGGAQVDTDRDAPLMGIGRLARF